MPTLPATDGLPVWAQILVSILICLATLAVALKGYFGQKPPPASQPESAGISLAAILGDIGAVRHLSDTILQLHMAVLDLTKSINETSHWNRNEVEVMRELCQRLREVAEEIERQGRYGRGSNGN